MQPLEVSGAVRPLLGVFMRQKVNLLTANISQTKNKQTVEHDYVPAFKYFGYFFPQDNGQFYLIDSSVSQC